MFRKVLVIVTFALMTSALLFDLNCGNSGQVSVSPTPTPSFTITPTATPTAPPSTPAPNPTPVSRVPSFTADEVVADTPTNSWLPIAPTTGVLAGIEQKSYWVSGWQAVNFTTDEREFYLLRHVGQPLPDTPALVAMFFCERIYGEPYRRMDFGFAPGVSTYYYLNLTPHGYIVAQATRDNQTLVLWREH